VGDQRVLRGQRRHNLTRRHNRQPTAGAGRNDADEGLVSLSVSGEVLPFRTIDDQNPADGYAFTGPIETTPHSLAYQRDTSFAYSLNEAATASWSFSGVTPGFYVVGLTWIDGAGNQYYSSSTPVTVVDGAENEGTFYVDQQDGPLSHAPYVYADNAYWAIITSPIEITSGMLTVTMTNVGANGWVLADGVILYRVPGQAIPPGNRESGGGPSPQLSPGAPAARAGDATLQPEERDALDDALLASAYWSDELEATATLLAEDSARDESSPFIGPVAADAGSLDDRELQLVLGEWLE
jgi:hypothetical protein